MQVKFLAESVCFHARRQAAWGFEQEGGTLIKWRQAAASSHVDGSHDGLNVCNVNNTSTFQSSE
jgi:hypothetical protein